MVDNNELRIKILGSQDFIDGLAESVQADSDNIRISSSSTVEDPTSLEFDVGKVADIVTILQGTAGAAKMAKFLYDQLKKHRQPVVFQTAVQRVELQWTDDLTEKEICDALIASTRLT